MYAVFLVSDWDLKFFSHQNNANDRIVNNNPFILDALFHPGSILTLSIKPIKQNVTHDQSSQNVQDINPNINFDFKENSPFQEGIILEMFQRPDI